MRALRCAFAILALLNASAAFAQQQAVAPAGGKPGPVSDGLTGKERLGKKWTDEQRIDNCRVPPDLRGAKPRPDKCSDGPPA